jgi:hypothetical protein
MFSFFLEIFLKFKTSFFACMFVLFQCDAPAELLKHGRQSLKGGHDLRVNPSLNLHNPSQFQNLHIQSFIMPFISTCLRINSDRVSIQNTI